MDPDIAQILWALGYLQFKHLAADFFLQTPYQFKNKGTYSHPGGILHAAIHMALTIPVIFFLPAGAGVLAAVVIGEGVLHYHIDWTKENVVRANGLTPRADRD